MLLPDQHPLQQAHKLRTLVLDVDDVLVQSTWNRGVGWKTFKRPGASDFLDVLCRQYELVVFANRSHSYVDPILNRVDPGIARGDGPTIAYRLYKNANSIRVRLLVAVIFCFFHLCPEASAFQHVCLCPLLLCLYLSMQPDVTDLTVLRTGCESAWNAPL